MAAPLPENCSHQKLLDKMAAYPDDRAMAALTEDEIRTKYPRLNEPCPDCGEQWIMYKSWAHYIAGGW